MPVTPEEQKYLRHKHIGGESGAKGTAYESCYAVYSIARYLHSHENQLNNVFFSSQVEDVFVDDFLIELPEIKIYHQLKNVKRLRWTEDLIRDFTRQGEISNENGELFSLKLIYSDQSSSVSKIPTKIFSYTKVEYFPSSDSINKLLNTNLNFKEAIYSIAPEANKNDDVLLGIALAILGVWTGSEQKSISLSNILESILKIGQGAINIKIFKDTHISDECIEIFNRLKIKISVQGIKLYWSYDDRFEGEVEWTKNIEQKILDANPTDFFELRELLY